jgi:type IV pilus assembly protein PilP
MRLTVIVLLLAALVVVVVASGPAAYAQTPAPAPTAPAPPPADAGPTPPPNYSYNPEGRRDPFISLMNRGTDARSGVDRGAARPEGLAGLLVDEVVVRGIVQTPRGYVAMVAAPTGRTYSVRAGDRLMDGSVRAVTAEAVILLQDVNDPLSLEKQREVRKYLRGEVK